MPRPLRIQYRGACYHVMSRGDRREVIFADVADRKQFVETLGRTCRKMGWQVHAYCLMSNHFHLVVETPQANLVAGMRWMLGTYTQRFNRRHRHWGHLFGGRYKAQLIDERSPLFLVMACNYVHLNPARAGLVGQGKQLETFPWSSYPAYLRPALRPNWLRLDRVLGAHRLKKDTAKSRREFSRRMERLCPTDLAGEYMALRRGWKMGAEDFVDWLAEEAGRPGRQSERARERRETDETLAERLVRAALKEAGWSASELKARPKGDAVKVAIARRLRLETPMTRFWIAKKLKMGSASYLSALLGSVDSKL